MPVIGLGATVAVNDGSGGIGSASAIIVDAVNLTVPDYAVGVVESKRLNLPSGVIVKIAALSDPGEFSFEYEFSTGKKTRLDLLIGSPRVFIITLPTDVGATWTRSTPGFIKTNKTSSVTAEGMQMATCTVVCSGPST